MSTSSYIDPKSGVQVYKVSANEVYVRYCMTKRLTKCHIAQRKTETDSARHMRSSKLHIKQLITGLHAKAGFKDMIPNCRNSSTSTKLFVPHTSARRQSEFLP